MENSYFLRSISTVFIVIIITAYYELTFSAVRIVVFHFESNSELIIWNFESNRIVFADSSCRKRRPKRRQFVAVFGDLVARNGD